MGLDMYLEKMPRYKGATAKDVSNIESYLSWLKAKHSKDDPYDGTLFEWCHVNEADLPTGDVIDYYTKFYNKKYAAWDTNHEYGCEEIFQQVGYWRKANAIHNWFVENVQHGIDDCHYHNECTEWILNDLLKTCKTVLESCVMTYGKVKNGQTFKDGEWEAIYEDGKIVIDPSVAEELLPTQEGFFFGGTDYDECYVQDIVDTIKILTDVLATTDFENEAIYYVSSW